MVVKQFLKMCLSSLSDTCGIFAAIVKAFPCNEIPWEKWEQITPTSVLENQFLNNKKNDKIILIRLADNAAHYKSSETKHKLQFRGTAC